MTKEQLTQAAIDKIAHITGNFDIETSMNIHDDLGFDSLDKIDILIEIENCTGKPISDFEADDWNTVEDIINSFHKHGGVQ